MTAAARPRLLVTGIAAGLGAEIAAAFAGAGYDVLGLSRSAHASGSVSALVAQGGGTYTHIPCDITLPADVAFALAPVADSIDVVIHNAQLLTIKPFADISADEFEQV